MQTAKPQDKTLMPLAKYKEMLHEPVRLTTIVLLRDGDRVLLGLKKTGFGKGNWLGIGGKVEQNERIERAAVREAVEEIGVKPTNLKKVAILDFYFPYVKAPEEWNNEAHVFITSKWSGKPTESEEIAPEWFDISKIPFGSMWSDARYWLPKVLAG